MLNEVFDGEVINKGRTCFRVEYYLEVAVSRVELGNSSKRVNVLEDGCFVEVKLRNIIMGNFSEYGQ